MRHGSGEALGSRDDPGPPCPSRLVVRRHGRAVLLPVAEIDWIEAAGNYASLHVRSESHMIRQTMAALELHLDPGLFFRIHRSTSVNIDRVKELQRLVGGGFEVILHTGTRLILSR